MYKITLKKTNKILESYCERTREPKMFCESKTTQIAAYLLHKAGGRMQHLKLMKLMYLADRFCLENYDRSMSQDNVVSMNLGPVLSKTYDLMKGAKKSDEWNNYMLPIQNKEISLAKSVDILYLGKLSKTDIKVLDEIYSQYGHSDAFDLSDFTHKLPEWRFPNGSSTPITVREILQAIGKEPEVVEQIVEDLEEKEKLEVALAAP